ncbi:MAG: hypothetical protein ACE5GW_09185, partial [Planctomycetota bacterium]
MPHPRRRVSSRASRSGRWKKGRFRRALRRRGLLPPPRTLRALRRLAERLPTSGNDLEIFHDGDLLYERMLEDIAGAGTRILMEMYMFLGDRTGRRFAEALARKAREGIPVRIIYDAIGCITTPSRLFDGLREAGAELLAYHPLAPWRRNFA